jgi:hypothetical protein
MCLQRRAVHYTLEELPSSNRKSPQNTNLLRHSGAGGDGQANWHANKPLRGALEY